jgi:chaperonin GroES
MTKFRPLKDRILAKPVEREERTASGIVLPDTAREEPRTAEVVTIGDLDDTKVEVGDMVVCAKFSDIALSDSWAYPGCYGGRALIASPPRPSHAARRRERTSSPGRGLSAP